MLKLSLSCREARQVIVKRHPNIMRVYQKGWSPGVKSRLVRCNPAVDTLVITAVAEFQLIYPYETMPGSDHFYKNGLKTQKEWFTNDAKLFAEFRDLISSWETLAFYYVGIPTLITDPPKYYHRTRHWSPNAHLIEGDPWDFEPWDHVNPRPSDYMHDSLMLMALVPYFKSLKRFLAWPHPKYWPELRKGAIVIDDVRNISLPEGTEMPKYVETLIEDVSGFAKTYNRSARIHNAHFMDSDENWAVKAKFMKRVGSFVAPSWVAGFDASEGSVGSCLVEEEQSEEIEFAEEYVFLDGDGDDDEHGSGDESSEDYSEEGEEDGEDEEGEDDYSDTDGEGEGSDEDSSDEEEMS